MPKAPTAVPPEINLEIASFPRSSRRCHLRRSGVSSELRAMLCVGGVEQLLTDSDLGGANDASVGRACAESFVAGAVTARLSALNIPTSDPSQDPCHGTSD